LDGGGKENRNEAEWHDTYVVHTHTMLTYSVPLRTGTSYIRDIFVLFLQD